MKKKNVYVILILAILLLPFKVHATENVSLSIDCSELIINESKTCNLYADVKESHQIKGVQGKVTGENVTFEEFKVSTSPSWSTSLVNGNAIAIANGTGYSGRTKLGTIKIKATALEGAKLSFTEVTYSIDSDEADEEEGNVEFTFTVKERQSSGTSESNTGNPTGGSGNSGGSGGSGGSSTTEPKDAECSLKSLEIENATMTPKFKPDIFEYEITTEATEINIKAEAKSAKATVTGAGKQNIANKNKVTVKVTSESGNVSVYTINIKHGAPVEKSNQEVPPTGVYKVGLLVIAVGVFSVGLFVFRNKFNKFKRI